MQRWSDEGLRTLLEVFPRAQARPMTVWVGLFTSQDAESVPARSAVLATGKGVTEAAGYDYRRQQLDAHEWGEPTLTPGGIWTSTAVPVEFPPVGPGGWGEIHGFFLASTDVAGVAFFYANFDDEEPIPSGVSDLITVTPTWAYAAASS